jgi:nicotinamidase-related amidase
MADTDRTEAFLSVDPARVAVVLVDFQNDFCESDGFRGSRPNNTANAATAVRANEFATAAAAHGTTTIYTRQVVDLTRLDLRQRRWEERSTLCRAGTRGAELFVPPVPNAATTMSFRRTWCRGSTPVTPPPIAPSESSSNTCIPLRLHRTFC